MTDFPRGWTLSSLTTSGSAADITIASLAGVSHVLTDVDAALVGGNGAASVAFAPLVQVLVSAVVALQWVLFIGATPANTPASDGKSFSGLQIKTPPGGTLEVKFNAAAGLGMVEQLVIQGYDL